MVLTSQTIKLIREFAEETKDPTKVRQYIRGLTGLKKTAAGSWYKKIFESNKLDFEIKGNQHIKTITSKNTQIKTLDELIHTSKIDLENWKVDKLKCNSYGDNYQVSAELKPKKEEKDIKELFDLWLEKIESFAPKTFVFEKTKSGGKLLILNIQDIHLGKLACNSETGWGNFDLKIGKEFYLEAVIDLINKAPQDEIETVLIIVGSDLLHFDTEQITTTAGTRLDSDSRWSKVYNDGCELITNVVELLASKFKVEVMVVTGNHSKLSEYALGSYVKAWFRNHPNVNVNNAPLDRKYYGWGINLIGFTHGDDAKQADLPLIMMRENQSTISNYTQFFVLSGHIHTDKLIEVKGIKLITAPALCPPDKWHSKNGYIGNIQTSQALLLDKNDGLEAIFYSKPPKKIT